MHIGFAWKKNMDHLEEFMKFHNETDYDRQRLSASALGTWMGDNCNRPTIYNKERRKWGIIGDVSSEDTILSDFNYTVSNFLYS